MKYLKITKWITKHNSDPSVLFFEFVLLVAAFMFSFITSHSLFKLSNVFVQTPDKQSITTKYDSQSFDKPIKTDNGKIISILLLGYGGAGHAGGTLSDVLMLARIDYANKKVALISIPRDLWIELPIRSDLKQYFKINMAHAIGVDDTRYGMKESQYAGEGGGGIMAKEAIEKVTGIKPDYFVSVSFDGFAQSIDAINGIDVNVPVGFEDKYYPVKGLENETCGFQMAEIDLFHRMYSGFELEKQFECRYETLSFSKGITHMNGETALKFVRSRHSDTHGGDFARSQRQQAVLDATKEKLTSLDAFTNYTQFVDIFSQTVRTDLNLETLGSLLDLVGNPENYETTNINLSTDNVLVNGRSKAGAFILTSKDGIGKWENVQSFIKTSLQ